MRTERVTCDKCGKPCDGAFKTFEIFEGRHSYCEIDICIDCLRYDPRDAAMIYGEVYEKRYRARFFAPIIVGVNCG